MLIHGVKTIEHLNSSFYFILTLSWWRFPTHLTGISAHTALCHFTWHAPAWVTATSREKKRPREKWRKAACAVTLVKRLGKCN